MADHVCNHFKIDLIENRTLIYHCFQEAIDFPHFKFSINGSSTVYGIWIQKSPPFHEEDQHVESSLPLGSSKTLMQIENPFGRSYRCIISPKNNEKDPVLDAFIRSQITNLVQEHPTIGWSKTFQKID
ncbi:MAG TPA: hypothetical protein VJK48_01225 [Chlamydiales bacterium]|nr:hypothetical protein [Chlamydiales bacterium]